MASLAQTIGPGLTLSFRYFRASPWREVVAPTLDGADYISVGITLSGRGTVWFMPSTAMYNSYYLQAPYWRGPKWGRDMYICQYSDNILRLYFSDGSYAHYNRTYGPLASTGYIASSATAAPTPVNSDIDLTDTTILNSTISLATTVTGYLLNTREIWNHYFTWHVNGVDFVCARKPSDEFHKGCKIVYATAGYGTTTYNSMMSLKPTLYFANTTRGGYSGDAIPVELLIAATEKGSIIRWYNLDTTPSLISVSSTVLADGLYPSSYLNSVFANPLYTQVYGAQGIQINDDINTALVDMNSSTHFLHDCYSNAIGGGGGTATVVTDATFASEELLLTNVIDQSAPCYDPQGAFNVTTFPGADCYKSGNSVVTINSLPNAATWHTQVYRRGDTL